MKETENTLFPTVLHAGSLIFHVPVSSEQSFSSGFREPVQESGNAFLLRSGETVVEEEFFSLVPFQFLPFSLLEPIFFIRVLQSSSTVESALT